jgi:phosphoribosyl-AMP cyclohydrolase
MEEILKQLKFDKDGLLCAVVQDYQNQEILMVAWMNKEAFIETLETGKVCYWSRSRRELWRKGETSGHRQMVKSIQIDCDGDAVLIKVDQIGGACHTGYRSCFYRKVKNNNEFEIVGQKIFDEKDVYKK